MDYLKGSPAMADFQPLRHRWLCLGPLVHKSTCLLLYISVLGSTQTISHATIIMVPIYMKIPHTFLDLYHLKQFWRTAAGNALGMRASLQWSAGWFDPQHKTLPVLAVLCTMTTYARGTIYVSTRGRINYISTLRETGRRRCKGCITKPI